MFLLLPPGSIVPGGHAVVAAQEATSQDPLPKGPGREVVESTCGVCHEIDTAIGKRRTRDDWQEMIKAMINRGAMGSEDEFKAVLAYLAKSFGVVNVNTAAAKDMADVLEIPTAEAEAIVRFRAEHGEIETFEALTSVPGVDEALLEKRKDRIAFK